jgi:hypothetical protein
MANSDDARRLAASVLQAMDTLDNAQTGTLTLAAQFDQRADQLVLAAWSSASQSFWTITRQDDGSLAAFQTTDGTSGKHTPLGQIHPTSIIPFGQDALVLDAAAKTLTRIHDGTTKTFTIPTQDAVVSAAVYDVNLYVLTDASIIKITGLDTDKPTTKAWLVDAADLAPGAAQLVVDGTIWTLSSDGMLTTYYKGKKTVQAQAAVVPSDTWQLSEPEADQLAVTLTNTGRIYLLNAKTGELMRTIKVDTVQPSLQLFGGQEGVFYLVTKDNKIWKVQ